MNARGQLGIGVIITVFIAIVTGVILLQASAPAVAQVTQTFNIVNNSDSNFPANAAVLVLNGQAVSNVVVYLENNFTLVPATNYTITNYDVSTGVLRSTLTGIGSTYSGQAINISYTYEPLGYARDAGSRAITNIILIFSALAVAVVALTPTLRNGVLDLFDFG